MFVSMTGLVCWVIFIPLPGADFMLSLTSNSTLFWIVEQIGFLYLVRRQ